MASASPLRVIVVSNGMTMPDNELVAHIQGPALTPKPAPAMPAHASCGGARLRQKVTSLADSLKIALGFHPSALKSGQEQQLKAAVMPYSPSAVKGQVQPHAERIDWVKTADHPQEHRRPGHGRFRYHGEQPSFLMRVHFALMSLGAWEGRAVAFVLGCGIGVLLRMFWVMSILTFRILTGPSPRHSDEHDEYTVIDIEDSDCDAEEIFVAPPTYTYPVDEKVEVVVPAPASN
ncbi:hypothetical protein B0H12DRAFT_235302 [Mycena haematopus]|nr:hypothetical protein B0H12DRAFT_235302 [Mycena haematopus]